MRETLGHMNKAEKAAKRRELTAWVALKRVQLAAQFREMRAELAQQVAAKRAALGRAAKRPKPVYPSARVFGGRSSDRVTMVKGVAVYGDVTSSELLTAAEVAHAAGVKHVQFDGPDIKTMSGRVLWNRHSGAAVAQKRAKKKRAKKKRPAPAPRRAAKRRPAKRPAKRAKRRGKR